jgi:hypothetical protein
VISRRVTGLVMAVRHQTRPDGQHMAAVVAAALENIARLGAEVLPLLPGRPVGPPTRSGRRTRPGCPAIPLSSA